MKISFIYLGKVSAFLLVLSSPLTSTFSQNFQRSYGTSLDNSFSKVIKDGSNYYVLGQDEFTDGTSAAATVTRLDANGNHQWTLSLNISSVWNDAVLTPSGDLLVVGSTLPFDATSKSLMGLVTPNGGGGFTWVRTYDVPGREGNTRIVRSPSPQNPAFPYYVVGSQFDPNGNDTWDDIFLLNINESGAFNWKKIFPSIDDDEFARNLDVLSNGDLILCGNKDNDGVILRLDNSGALIGGALPEFIQFSYADVTPISGGGFYAVGGTFPSFTAHLIKYDANLIEIWNATISGLTSVSQVWEESSSGVIYVVGNGVFNGVNRGVVLLFVVFGQTPTLQWIKFLDNNESSYVGGSINLFSSNEFSFVDGRVSTSAGFGQQDAFMSVNDLQFTTCITDDDLVNVNSVSFTYISPFLPDIEFFDFSTGTDLVSSELNWQQEDVCNNNPCNADFIVTPIGSCGHYQVTNTSTGAQPLTYLWCDGSTSQDLDVQLPCGPYTFCLTITDANGCSSSHSESVNVVDHMRPTAICAPGFGVTLDTACQAVIIPSMIDGGSTDNCQIQSLSVSPAVLTGCGLFPVTLTVTDWCGNTNVCTTDIQTIENVPPVITCPSTQQLSTASPSCNMVVNGLQWTLLTDNCSSPTVTYDITGASNYTGTGDASGLIFDQGSSTVTYTATDGCGNTSSCSFEVNVTCICDCPNNLLLNGGFYEGAIAGNNLGISGQSDHWLNGGLSPQVVKEDSCCDAYCIQLWGNYYNGESIYQQGLNFQAGHHYKISFCARYWPGYPNVNSINFGFNAASSTTNPYNCQPCEQIGLSPQITSTSWGAYTMPIWTPTQNHNLMYIRAVSITGYQSWGRIDNVCIEEVPYTCCGDEDAFVANMRNAVNFSFDENTQEGICTIGNLPACDSVAYIDWGDGHIDVGPFGGNTVRRNRFLDHLLARVQFQAHEFNTDTEPDEACFEHIFMDSIDVYSIDTCVCGSFSELFIHGPRGQFSQFLECGGPPVNLTCLTDGASYTLTGLLRCIGDPCADEASIGWTLSGPGGLISGTTTANPYFAITLLPTYLTQPGLYTLSFNGQCGNQSCPCEIQFTIDCLPQCDCTALDVVDFGKRVERGFATIYRENSCEVCFSPIALNGCDSVEWHLNSTDVPPIGRSAGREPFCYTFPNEDQYNVIMNVTKKKDDGSKCDKQMRLQQVMPCEFSSACDNPVFDNPGFNLGAQAGGLNSGGMSRGWNALSGEPEVIEGEPGSADGWSIKLSGNLDTASTLSRTNLNCLDKIIATCSTSVKSGKSNSSDRTIGATMKFYLGTKNVFDINDCNSADCYELASITLPVLDSATWLEIEIPYDLSDWDRLDTCGGILVRPIIYVTNTLGNNQGGENTYSYVQLDNFCFNGTIVAVDEPKQKEGVRIYPNPTSGELTVEMPSSYVDDVVMRVVSITGQVMAEKEAQAGISVQHIEVEELSAGMYFLQLVSNDRVLTVNKFVKQ